MYVQVFRKRERKTVKWQLVLLYVAVLSNKSIMFLWSCQDTKWVFWAELIFWIFLLPTCFLFAWEWLKAHRGFENEIEPFDCLFCIKKHNSHTIIFSKSTKIRSAQVEPISFFVLKSSVSRISVLVCLFGC